MNDWLLELPRLSERGFDEVALNDRSHDVRSRYVVDAKPA